jgi:hypothetical protein
MVNVAPLVTKTGFVNWYTKLDVHVVLTLMSDEIRFVVMAFACCTPSAIATAPNVLKILFFVVMSFSFVPLPLFGLVSLACVVTPPGGWSMFVARSGPRRAASRRTHPLERRAQVEDASFGLHEAQQRIRFIVCAEIHTR